jgi:cbb3-type cytochrome oxidase subunit 1
MRFPRTLLLQRCFGDCRNACRCNCYLQLAFPALNLGIEYTTFGRLRPVHTNAVIFAFVGNGIFTAVYYSLPRLVKAEMWSKALSKIHFWGWQLIILTGYYPDDGLYIS